MRVSLSAVMAASICLALLPGCGTAQNMTQSFEVYGGVKRSVAKLKEKPEETEEVQPKRYPIPVYAADVGLSAIGDTLTLPITLPIQIVVGIFISIAYFT
jgi:uncharacterized protein YceK